MAILPESYRILITPLICNGQYGDIIDVTQDIDISDSIEQSGVGVIKQEIDTGDFDFGAFTFGNVNLKGINKNGALSEINNNFNTIFRYKRDQAKVEIQYFDGTSNTPITRFSGLLNEDGSKQDFGQSQTSLDVFSLTSVIRKLKVTGGQVGSDILFSRALKNLLAVPEVTDLIIFDENNINVEYDDTIDDGSVFDGLQYKETIDQLLLVSNSIMYVDENNKLIISPRREKSATHFFYGGGDELGRENIIDIRQYNTGLQRAFSSIKINDIEVTDEPYAAQYGIRQKSFSLSFVLGSEKLTNIAKNLLDSYKVPKPEFGMTVKTKDAKNIRLLDSISVNYPLRTQPPKDKKMAIYDASVYDDPDYVYPLTFGNFGIDKDVKWKVIGILEDTKKFLTVLKLRQAGIKNLPSGYFGYDVTFEFSDSTNFDFSDGSDFEFSEAP